MWAPFQSGLSGSSWRMCPTFLLLTAPHWPHMCAAGCSHSPAHIQLLSAWDLLAQVIDKHLYRPCACASQSALAQASAFQAGSFTCSLQEGGAPAGLRQDMHWYAWKSVRILFECVDHRTEACSLQGPHAVGGMIWPKEDACKVAFFWQHQIAASRLHWHVQYINLVQISFTLHLNMTMHGRSL